MRLILGIYLLILFRMNLQYGNYKLIYRRYAGLYFMVGVDATDNELLMMETLHLFVEVLDENFSNVCEVRAVCRLFCD